MAGTNKNRNIIRVSILVLTVFALLGPWMYDRIHVPAEYACGLPFIRLEGDFCGLPMSWLSWFKLFAGGFILTLGQLLAGSYTGQARELLAYVLFLLPVLPFFSTLLLLAKKPSRRLWAVHVIAWGLGCSLPLLALAGEWQGGILPLWGLWLYLLLAVVAMTLETIPGEGWARWRHKAA